MMQGMMGIIYVNKSEILCLENQKWHFTEEHPTLTPFLHNRTFEIPAHRRLGQEDQELKTSFGHTGTLRPAYQSPYL